jgi:hypothetical protein
MAGPLTYYPEIPRNLWSPKIYYCLHKSSPLHHIFCHINSIHTTMSHFFTLHSNIVLPLTLLLPCCLFSSYFRLERCMHFLSSRLFHACYTPLPSRPLQFGSRNNMWRIVQIISLLIDNRFDYSILWNIHIGYLPHRKGLLGQITDKYIYIMVPIE